MGNNECQGFEPDNIENAITIFNQIPECIHWKDRNLNYVLMNDHTANLVGYPSSDISFKGVSDKDLPCKASELADTFSKEDRIVLRSGKTITMVNICCYKNNEWKLILGRKSPLTNKSNEIIGVYGRGIDVTECGLMRTTFMVFIHDEARFGKNRNVLNQASYILKETIDDYGLSPRESECLFFLIRGKTAKEISLKLGISTRTVENHIINLKYKMKCNNRSQIVEKAICEGLGSVIPKSILIPANIDLLRD